MELIVDTRSTGCSIQISLWYWSCMEYDGIRAVHVLS